MFNRLLLPKENKSKDVYEDAYNQESHNKNGNTKTPKIHQNTLPSIFIRKSNTDKYVKKKCLSTT